MKYGLMILVLLFLSSTASAENKIKKSTNPAFNSFDINQDGLITVEEFDKIINDKKDLLLEEELELVVFPTFEDYDLDKDGKIPEQEFVKGQKIFLDKQKRLENSK